MIRNLLIIILMTVACANYGYAQIIVSEDFNYTNGSNLGSANGGTGWSAGWEATSSERTVVNDTLRNYRTGKGSGSFLNLTVTDSAENLRYVRPLASEITDDGNTYWLGFTMDLETTGGNVANLILLDTAGTSFKLIVGRIGNGKIAVGPPGGFRSVDGLNTQQVNWLVAKISFTGDAENDTVRLFVNPDPSVVPNDDMADATYIGGQLNTATINGILLRAENATSITARFDDIYLGNSYNDILPASAVDINKYLPVREKFEYTADAGISGNGTISDGWGGPWELTNSPDQNIVSQSVTNNTIARNTTGNSLQMLGTSGNTRLTRPLSQTYEDNGLTYWFSFFADFQNADGNDIMNVMLVNSDANTFGSGGAGGQFLAVGKLNAAFEFGLGKFQGGFNKSPDNVVLTQDGAHWFVCTIETTANSDGDTVRLWLDPDPSVKPLNGTETVKYVVNTLNDGWQGIGIKNGSGTNNSLIDDIYLALDFEDVVPEDLEEFALPAPAFEKFDYAADAVLTGNGGTENGWGGPWKINSGPDQLVVAESITNSNILKITEGNSLLMSSIVGETRLERPLAEAYTDNGLTYWLSFFADFRNSTDNGLMNVMLIDTAAFGGGGPGGQLVAVGKWTAPERIAVASFPTFSATTLDGAAVGGNWFVARIETNGTSEDDTVRLFLNPDPNVEPVPGEEVITFVAKDLDNGWNGIGIKNGPGVLLSRIDDIYLGSSFTQVVPSDLIDVAIPAPAFEKFSYTSNEAIEGNGDASDGWAGPWELVGGASQSLTDEPVTNEAIFRETTGNSLFIDSELGATRLARPLSDTYEDNGLTYWLSFFADFNNTIDNGVTTVMLINNDIETMGASGPAGQFAAIGKWTTPASIAVGSFGPFEGTVLEDAAEGTNWFVASIETNGTEARDTIRLYLNPSPDQEPIAGTEVLKFAASELTRGWNAIGIKTDAGVTNSRIDDLYLSANFSEVVPDDLVDIQFLFEAGATYEPFAYGVDANISGNGGRSSGFGGPWIQTSGDNVTVSAGSIETDFAVFEGNKANVNFTDTEILYDRPLSGRFEDDGSTVWMSFLIDFEDIQKISTEGQVALTNGGEEIVGFGRTSGFNRIGFTWSPDVFQFISNTNSDDEHWVVVRLDFSGDANAENIYMWIDPDPTVQPSTRTANVVMDESSSQRLSINEGFDGIRLKTTGGAPFQMFVDEIRLGFSFGDVSKLEEEIPEGLLAREQFRYDAGDQLNNLGGASSQWAGSWQEIVAGEKAEVQAGSLSVPGVSLNTVGEKGFFSGGSRYIRPLATPTTDDGNGYWLSWIAKVDFSGGVVAQGGFSNNAEPLIIFGKKFNDATVSILDIGGGGGGTVQTAINASETSWFVTFVQFSGDADVDSIYLWLNPDPTTTPSLASADAVMASTALNDGFKEIFFRTEGGTADYSIDEIYFGTSFEAVAPVGGDTGPIAGLEDLIDNQFDLYNYPNPFAESTIINYSLKKAGSTQLTIVNLQGQLIVTLKEENNLPGDYTVQWDGRDESGNKLPTGVYFYRLMQDDLSVTKRLVLINR